MEAVFGSQNDVIGQTTKNWLESNIKEEFNSLYLTVAFLKENTIKAASLFTNYNGSNIEMHYFGDSVSRGNFRTVLNYVFNHLKCNRLTVIPLREDIKSLIALKRLGFLQETILKNYYGVDDSKDGLVYVMDKARAKNWIKINE